jgi:hypothetical protein
MPVRPLPGARLPPLITRSCAPVRELVLQGIVNCPPRIRTVNARGGAAKQPNTTAVERVVGALAAPWETGPDTRRRRHRRAAGKPPTPLPLSASESSPRPRTSERVTLPGPAVSAARTWVPGQDERHRISGSRDESGRSDRRPHRRPRHRRCPGMGRTARYRGAEPRTRAAETTRTAHASRIRTGPRDPGDAGTERGPPRGGRERTAHAARPSVIRQQTQRESETPTLESRLQRLVRRRRSGQDLTTTHWVDTCWCTTCPPWWAREFWVPMTGRVLRESRPTPPDGRAGALVRLSRLLLPVLGASHKLRRSGSLTTGAPTGPPGWAGAARDRHKLSPGRAKARGTLPSPGDRSPCPGERVAG